MIQRIFYGNTVEKTNNAVEIDFNVQVILSVLVVLVLVMGVYPQPMIDLTKDTVNAIFAHR
jgi:NADH-quinone oxidoreductase subunit M